MHFYTLLALLAVVPFSLPFISKATTGYWFP